MAATPCTDLYNNNSIFLRKNRSISLMALSPFPFHQPTKIPAHSFSREQKVSTLGASTFLKATSSSSKSKRLLSTIPRCSDSSNVSGDKDEEISKKEKTPFGYSRKDVILIGVGVTGLGIGLKSGLEYVGVDPLQAGNVVQLVLVLGLTVGWISTYIFRVSNKEMTYATQLRDYEDKVMQKRLESLTEAEIVALVEQVEEEKRQLAAGEQLK
ncbi:hypothetical protein ABFS82_09G059900 [Erythranthe guttata]|uniref:Uncharacterized protein n=1 Tax=Erythranthe guttata TaxID=4155 RepID=A0A022RJE2_ERYGU|nr:PREDICTED: uncharacterized protein LOC105955046 [Erythranthe guttata]EYU40114.1 hypothetical protein MIMGU_mgv1a013745mg [Erythranthe guttata]|eukprot:XP_012834199.1 PREDICTED: uncharacterized protein LOC105955046 [Erythranthe guttata]